jgi:hypothetical protein
MADFTKAGSDKGDLEQQLKHHLISANITYQSYICNIESLTEEELKADLEEYITKIQIEILPLIEQAESLKEENLISKAYQVKSIYNDLIESIKAQLEKVKK